jgi:hypothetical protein
VREEAEGKHNGVLWRALRVVYIITYIAIASPTYEAKRLLLTKRSEVKRSTHPTYLSASYILIKVQNHVNRLEECHR